MASGGAVHPRRDRRTDDRRTDPHTESWRHVTLVKLDPDPDHLFHAASHILGAIVRPDVPLRIRHSRVLASRGDLTYHHESHELDASLRDTVERSGWRAAVGDESFTATARSRIEMDVAGDLALTGNLKMHRASGGGQIWLGHEGGDVSVFHLADDELIVLAQGEVLAHDDALDVALERRVPREMAIVRDTTYAWVMRGTGHVATATPGETVVLDVTEDDPVLVEGDALLAYTSGIELTPPDDYERRAAMRGVKWLLKNIPQINLSTGRERIWMVANGRGSVVIRSGDQS